MEKVFPGLMSGKKIMYVHGFLSSAASGTVRLLRELMPECSVVARDVPLHPAEGLEMLRRMQADEQPDLIIGTSMGGLYTELLTGSDRIIVNPAFDMADHMSECIGHQTFQSPREDGVNEVIVTKGLIREYKDLCAMCLASEPTDDTVYGLFGDEDPIGTANFPRFKEKYADAVWFHGGHRLTDHVALHYLAPVIRWIDDKQEGRERPVLYMHYDALHDSYGKAVGSMRKAYEMLTEHFCVYIVADERPYDGEWMADVELWVAENLSAPAYGHVIFCRRKGLLYGDYFIDVEESPEFMGTCVRVGSPDFKTFDEVITFFERLNLE